MSIVLYKPGNTYTSPKGVRCQFQICNPHSYKHLLNAGWFLTPEECYPEEAEETEEETPEPEEEEVPELVFDVNSLYEKEPKDAE